MIEILYFIPILLSAYVIGFKIFNFFNVKTTKLEESIFSVVFGFGFYSYLAFFLGVAGFLYSWVFWLAILFSLILWHRLWLQLIKSILSSFKKFKIKCDLETFLIVVIAVFSVLALLSTLIPPFLWDELDYELGIPKYYVMHHAIVPNFSSWASERTYHTNMLYVIGLLLKNGVLAKFFALTNGLLLMFSIYAFGKKFYNRAIGLLASSIYITLPMIMNHIGLV